MVNNPTALMQHISFPIFVLVSRLLCTVNSDLFAKINFPNVVDLEKLNIMIKNNFVKKDKYNKHS